MKYFQIDGYSAKLSKALTQIFLLGRRMAMKIKITQYGALWINEKPKRCPFAGFKAEYSRANAPCGDWCAKFYINDFTMVGTYEVCMCQGTKIIVEAENFTDEREKL